MKLYIHGPWASEDNMKFNGTKFQLMRFGNDEIIKENTIYFTENMSEVIDPFENVKDLGVIMNNKATFSDHRKSIKKGKAKVRLDFKSNKLQE